MPKFDIKNIKLRKVTVDELSDNMLLINLYATQALTFIIGLAWAFFQGQNILEIFRFQGSPSILYWAAGLAVLVVAFDVGISRWIPDEAKDDGGVNERIFRKRPLWHIALLCAVVSICEELLFRGAIQHAFGPYWTSILFAAIHVRYLRHWIPTGMVFAISYGLGWLLAYTGTIWAPIFTHFLVDLTMGIIIRYRREEE
ncbi:CPBP family intramembrane metalloprotease [Cohnella ginsengisoli]|uniref:CPBP family intramembrane metalloprotease n=1 Tax=Cohnella ginsengisoli TaxID=425004 RepID=A0A9X4KDN7_9BACL|nr:type II CAAX endopeptidase family protein [Cohnella ginsengisoli]MDG0789699.1 CPBP family intramembrane metalloprotease [Cohnella ginsengisoli]